MHEPNAADTWRDEPAATCSEHGSYAPKVPVQVLECGGDAAARELLGVARSMQNPDGGDDTADVSALTDGLTGLCTHSVLKEMLELEVLSAQRQNTSLSLIFADVDHFSRINGRYGPSFGDRVIREI